MPEVRLVHFQVVHTDSAQVMYVLDENGIMWYTFNFRDQDAWVKVRSPKHEETQFNLPVESDVPEESDLTPVNS